MSVTQYEAGDIVFTRGQSFVSAAIRWFSRSTGESRTMVNHCGVVVKGGGLYGSDGAEIVEALTTVKRRRLRVYANSDKTAVAVYRPTNVSPDEIVKIVDYCTQAVGRKYNYPMIVAHAIDRLVFNHAYVVRRLVGADRYPICSWIVAQAYSRAGYTFGVEPGQADPDDIWDHCLTSGHYKPVHHLGKLD